MNNSKTISQLTLGISMSMLSVVAMWYALHDGNTNIFMLAVSLVSIVVGARNLGLVYRHMDKAMPTDILCDPVSFYGFYLVPTARGMARIEVYSLENDSALIQYRVERKMDQAPNQYLDGQNDEFCFFHHYPNHFVFYSLPEAFASLERWQKKVKLPTS